MYEQEKKKFLKVLEGVRGVSLTVDAWTTDNMIPFLGITIHWIDDTWTLRERVLAISKLAGEHTGDHLGTILHAALEEFKLKTKVMGLLHYMYIQF